MRRFAVLQILFFTLFCSLLADARRASAQLQRTEAYIGEPFGVAKITIPIKQADRDLLRTNGLIITEASGRIHYPVFSTGIFKKVVDIVAGDSDATLPKNMSAYFLFTGDEPFTAKVYTSSAFTVRVEPAAGRRFQRNLLNRTWWREYTSAARQRKIQSDYPPLIETYLTSMLGERLQLPKPLIERTTDIVLVKDEVNTVADLFLGEELRHLKLIREAMLGDSPVSGKATIPLPRDVFPQVTPGLAPEDGSVQIEEIASRVPEECFYVRFGEWQNQVWLTRLAREYGGDLSRMAILRGIESNASHRIEEQLCLEQDPLAESFGQTVISDFAVVGRDLYLNEGAAVGVLFQQRNALLSSQLGSARAKIFEREKANGATKKIVEIAGKKVSLISTADNRLRSFYAREDGFHLITNCRRLVERFFECGTGKGSLKSSLEFQEARKAYPLERGDTVFFFMPSNFFSWTAFGKIPG